MLLGYANEVGEAFRALVNVKFVYASYGLASAYVLADTNDKASKAKKLLGTYTINLFIFFLLFKSHLFTLVSYYKLGDSEGALSKVGVAAFDTLVWQALASVIIPGFTINRICAASLFAMGKTIPKVSLNARKWMTTGIGLGVIPFIVHPIDSLVHYGMDNTTRKWIGGADVKLD